MVHESGRDQTPELYGVSDDTTTVYMYPQALPGDIHRLVCVGTCHYPQGGCLGAIMLIDLRRDLLRRGPDPDEADYVPSDTQYAGHETSRRTYSSSDAPNPAGTF